jgi:ribonuclease HI
MTKTAENQQIIIYTDGSTLRNPGGPGGWAYLIQMPDGTEVTGSGGVWGADVTNNRMELTAIIRAVEALPPKSKARIVTDSQYAIATLERAMDGGRIRVNGDFAGSFRRAAVGHEITFQFVRGHIGIEGNERVDELAGDAARSVWLGRFGETWEERDRSRVYMA